MNEDFVTNELAVKLKEKGFSCEMPFAMYNEIAAFHLLTTSAPYNVCDSGFKYREYYDYEDFDEYDYIAPTISQVLKWLRKEKNIDVEIHADVGMLGVKVYSPYISTYTEFTLETSPDVVRYRQKKFNPTTRLPHEIIPAHIHFKEWAQAALAGIEYVLDNLI